MSNESTGRTELLHGQYNVDQHENEKALSARSYSRVSSSVQAVRCVGQGGQTPSDRSGAHTGDAGWGSPVRWVVGVWVVHPSIGVLG
jgi:hypothetical protein